MSAAWMQHHCGNTAAPVRCLTAKDLAAVYDVDMLLFTPEGGQYNAGTNAGHTGDPAGVHSADFVRHSTFFDLKYRLPNRYQQAVVTTIEGQPGNDTSFFTGETKLNAIGFPQGTAELE